jgi:hypothetical protein
MPIHIVKIRVFLISLTVLITLSCSFAGVQGLIPATPTNQPSSGLTPTLVFIPTPQIVLQRLHVTYDGLDGNKVVGSGCPGDAGRGTIIDHHFSVAGVDTGKKVSRIIMTGDNSTLTWAMPCSDNWELSALDSGNGNWDILIAPSEPSLMYTVMFFYTDNSVALGMTTVPQN